MPRLKLHNLSDIGATKNYIPVVPLQDFQKHDSYLTSITSLELTGSIGSRQREERRKFSRLWHFPRFHLRSPLPHSLPMKRRDFLLLHTGRRIFLCVLCCVQRISQGFLGCFIFYFLFIQQANKCTNNSFLSINSPFTDSN